MNFVTKEKARRHYGRHFGEDYRDFEHIYEILVDITQDVLSYNKQDLRKYGHYFAKAPVKRVRMEWAEDNLIELTPKQADFICTMGVVIISRAMMMLNIKPSDKDEE